MDLDIVDTFILNGQQYECIEYDWRRNDKDEGLAHPFSLEWLEIQKGASYFDDFMPRIAAKYEFIDDVLYLKEIICRKNAFYVQDFEKKINTDNDRLETYHILGRLEFTGRIRLARNAVGDTLFYAARRAEHPIAFETVLDLILSDDRILNINDRSKVLELRRQEFIKQFKSGEVQSLDDKYTDLKW